MADYIDKELFIASLAETAAVLGRYLEGGLQRDIREGLSGNWTLKDLRLLLFAHDPLATYGEE